MGQKDGADFPCIAKLGICTRNLRHQWSSQPPRLSGIVVKPYTFFYLCLRSPSISRSACTGSMFYRIHAVCMVFALKKKHSEESLAKTLAVTCSSLLLMFSARLRAPVLSEQIACCFMRCTAPGMLQLSSMAIKEKPHLICHF